MHGDTAGRTARRSLFLVRRVRCTSTSEGPLRIPPAQPASPLGRRGDAGCRCPSAPCARPARSAAASGQGRPAGREERGPAAGSYLASQPHLGQGHSRRRWRAPRKYLPAGGAAFFAGLARPTMRVSATEARTARRTSTRPRRKHRSRQNGPTAGARRRRPRIRWGGDRRCFLGGSSPPSEARDTCNARLSCGAG